MEHQVIAGVLGIVLLTLGYIAFTVTAARKVTTTVEFAHVGAPLVANPNTCYLIVFDNDSIDVNTLDALNKELLDMKIQHILVGARHGQLDHTIKCVQLDRPYHELNKPPAPQVEVGPGYTAPVNT